MEFLAQFIVTRIAVLTSSQKTNSLLTLIIQNEDGADRQKHSPPNPLSRRAEEGEKTKTIRAVSLLIYMREGCKNH